MIYFIRATQSGAIKIGVSNDPKRRLETMQTGSSEILELIGVMPGQVDLERSLHRRFGKHRIHGEWFKGTPELVAAIKTLVKGHEQPTIHDLVDSSGTELWLIRGAAGFGVDGCDVEIVCVCRERGAHPPDADAMLDAVHPDAAFMSIDMIVNITSRQEHWPQDPEVLREPLTSKLSTDWAAWFASSDQFFPVLSLQQKQAMRQHPLAGIEVGADVLHPQYGEGKVVIVHGFGSERRVCVDFTFGGTKRFILERCPLKLVGGQGASWEPRWTEPSKS